MWFSGPPFLRLPEKEWPQNNVTEIPLDECRMTIPTYSKDRTFDLLPNVERFSRWTRLIRATAAVKSCAMFWLQKIREKPRKCTKLPLSVSDLIEAEKHWFREIQQAKYCDEIEALKDPKHPATKLLIMDAHVRNHHQGREQVVNTLREKYWIPKIRVAVKSSWNNCQHCKNLRAKPRVPEMSALPKARVGATAYPFERTGIDYFGPLMVKVGRRHEKRWGVLFTCMATRAVHLEVAHSLTTDATIMAIRRLESTHGPIKEMFCDNGTNLIGADNEFRQLYEALDESHKLTDACSTRKIKFSFNPPSSPHMGGSWERLVSRPLTYVSVDPKDNTALTPNQILIPNTGDSDDNRPIGTFEDRDLIMRKAWRRAQYLADLFWRRWIREYLPELARRTKWYDPCPPIGIGDIVVVCDPQLPRNKWPMGRITDVFPGPDKKIRSANVQTKEGVYHRPVAILARLDVQKEIDT
ncbi:uncharacterized protein LOC129788162 isoform X2 [Lutzomyia longipalpis]|uniref:uncharacterized protein LOC129788162 isoform X2 n=1 Tax=Lutzomyia longipalpis TaxID=7200 RepID=UPI002483EC54|nr:uncharacterized protein LOC129788162 isoform X2 [Lutzomyia longipalpis]